MTVRGDDNDQHHEFDPDGDAAAMPGPNFLAQFRRPMSEAEMDEVARALEGAIAAWLADVEAHDPS